MTARGRRLAELGKSSFWLSFALILAAGGIGRHLLLWWRG